jgi:hypothetical protein
MLFDEEMVQVGCCIDLVGVGGKVLACQIGVNFGLGHGVRLKEMELRQSRLAALSQLGTSESAKCF